MNRTRTSALAAVALSLAFAWPAAAQPIPTVALEDFGGGCGVPDNTAPINAAAASVSGPVKVLALQPCNYTFTSQNAIDFPKNVVVQGGGRGVTQFKYVPTGDGTFLKWTAPIAPIPAFGGGIRDLTVWSPDKTYTKVMIDEAGFSGFTLENVNCGWDSSAGGAQQAVVGGTGSTCFYPKGWDFGYVHHAWFAADRPVRIGMNPYWSYAQDHWHWQDVYYQGTTYVGLFPIITVDPGVAFSNTTFDGYQSIVNGSFGFIYQDTAAINSVYQVAAGGGNYAVGDDVTLSPGPGGACSAAPHATVLAVSGGAVTAASVSRTNTGTCSAQPSGDLWTQSATTGVGSGAQFRAYAVGGYNLSFSNVRVEQGAGTPSNYWSFFIAPRSPLYGLTIDNSLLDGLRNGVYLKNVVGSNFGRNVSIGGSAVPVYLIAASKADKNDQVSLDNNVWVGGANYSSSFSGMFSSNVVPSSFGGSTPSTARFSASAPPNAISNNLTSSVALNNTSNFFTGPSVTIGLTGTWFVSGSVTLIDTAGSAYLQCRLWDGNSVFDHGTVSTPAANGYVTVSLSGIVTNSATGNVFISCRDFSSTSGQMLWSTGDGKSSTLTATQF